MRSPRKSACPYGDACGYRSARVTLPMTPMRFAQAVVLYFVLVFVVGFGVRFAREAAMEPAWGVRTAELVQGAAFLAAILPAAWLVAWAFKEATWEQLFVAGIMATVLVALADALIGAELRGQTLEQLLFKRDSLEGGIYYALVGVLAVAPALFSLRRPESRRLDHAE